jgi:hypothetical protein
LKSRTTVHKEIPKQNRKQNLALSYDSKFDGESIGATFRVAAQRKIISPLLSKAGLLK